VQIREKFQEKLQPWWLERSRRERTMLSVWAAAVAVLGLWFGACAPLLQRIAILDRRVPELELQLNRMRTQPSAGKNAAATSVPQSGEDLRSVLYAQLAERKISAELRALSPTRVEMRLPQMPMRDALEILDALRGQTGARVAVFSARNDEATGTTARIVVELERAS